MLKRASTLFVMSLLVTPGFAKDKKANLPAYVLTAKTVAVIIDPTAGISIEDPRANQDAQKDVEAALLSWGRFEPVLSTRMADLIIVVRRGNGRMMNETMPDPRQNDRPGSVTQTDNGISMGGQHGPQPGLSGGPVGRARIEPDLTQSPDGDGTGRRFICCLQRGRRKAARHASCVEICSDRCPEPALGSGGIGVQEGGGERRKGRIQEPLRTRR